MPTLRQAIEKVSDLRSKIAMIETVFGYVKENYTGDDAGEAEMSVIRADAAQVPQEHVNKFLEWLQSEALTAAEEIEEWENMQIQTEETAAPAPKRKAKKSRGHSQADG